MTKPDKVIDLLVDDEKLHGLRLLVAGEQLPKGSRFFTLKLRVSTEQDQAAYIDLTVAQMKSIGKRLISEAGRVEKRR